MEKVKINKYSEWHWDGVDPAYFQFESISDHCSRTIYLVYNFLDFIQIDKFKIIKMSLFNDIYEAFREDNSFTISYEQIVRLELEAHSFRVQSLLNEYEEGNSLEAKLIKDFHLLGLIIQTVEFENSHGINFHDLIFDFNSKICHDIISKFASVAIAKRPTFAFI